MPKLNKVLIREGETPMTPADALSTVKNIKKLSLIKGETSASPQGSGKLTTDMKNEVKENMMTKITPPVPALATNEPTERLPQRQLAQLGVLEKQMLAASRYLHQQRLMFLEGVIRT